MVRDLDGDSSWHDHGHEHGGHHGHTHGTVDPSIATSEKGIWAVKWSFVGLFATALLQVIVVLISGSVALLSDTITISGTRRPPYRCGSPSP
jgi:Co/Zn/Cd efflux system component